MPAAQHSPVVLLLAGDEFTRRTTTHCLEGFGFTVIGTRSAAEAGRLLHAQAAGRRIDVLVTDTDVRDEVDGLSLGALARRLNARTSVIYTARMPHAIPRAGRVDGAPCLRTPYQGHQLVSVINGLRATPAETSRNAA
ncbi:response regulator [Methylobacterium sp. JK268]